MSVFPNNIGDRPIMFVELLAPAKSVHFILNNKT